MLKKILPQMQKLSKFEPELDELTDQRKKLQKQIDDLQAILNKMDGKIQEGKLKDQEHRNRQNEIRDEAAQFNDNIDKAREELQNCYKTKDEMREQYYKNLYEFELQNDKIRHIKQMISQKKRMTEEREEIKARIEKKKSELNDMSNPNLKEIDTCEHLILYCQKLKVQQGMVPPTSEEVARKTQYDLISEFNRQDIEQKLKDRKIEAVESKKDETVQIGGGKGKKGKKNKREPKQEQAESFSIDFGAIAKFGLVGVSPPSSPDELDPKIEELKQKKAWF